MVRRKVELVNRLGLHARAAAKLVHLTSTFDAEIQVGHDEEEVNGKSILGLLLLAAPCGSTLTIVADGSDEDAAVEAVEQLIKERFGESE